MRNFFDEFVKRRTGEELSSRSSFHRTVYILLPLLIYYLVGDLVEVGLWALINGVISGNSERFLAFATLHGSDIRAVIYAVSVVVILLILRKMAINEITHVTENENPEKLSASQDIGYIVFGLSGALFFNLLAVLTNFTKISSRFAEGLSGQTTVNFAIGLVIYGVVSPVAEEILFRGIIFNRMRRLFPVPAAIIVTSILFGVFHGNIVQGVYGFLMGLAITWAYEVTRNLTVPLMMHIVANIAVFSLTYRDLFGKLPLSVLLCATVITGGIFAFRIFQIWRGSSSRSSEKESQKNKKK